MKFSTAVRLAAVFVATPLVAVACSDDSPAQPTTGALEVTVATTGEAPDADGYELIVQGAIHMVDINETQTFDELDEGSHDIELTGVALNCVVAGDNPRSVVVVAGETTQSTFDVDCPAMAP